MLSLCRHLVPTNTLTVLYHSLFSSHITYGCQVWGQNRLSIDRLFKLQKKALRIMACADYTAHTNPLFRRYHILKFPDYIYVLNCLLVHDVYHRKSPSCLKDLTDFFSDIHNHYTRGTLSASASLPPINSTRFGKLSIKFQCANSWNNIPKHHCLNPHVLTKTELKRKLIESILNKY